LPKATDELDTIVQATAEATKRIMDAAEKVSGVASELSDPQASDLMNAVTSIYEACSFQDITGQRIAKVVTTLKVIVQRIERMVASLNGKPVEADGADQVPNGWVTGQSAQAGIDALFGDASKDLLLHGPAAKGQGTSQADIDALFGAARSLDGRRIGLIC
jgi:chemotaxis protein CheZ